MRNAPSWSFAYLRLFVRKGYLLYLELTSNDNSKKLLTDGDTTVLFGVIM